MEIKSQTKEITKLVEQKVTVKEFTITLSHDDAKKLMNIVGDGVAWYNAGYTGVFAERMHTLLDKAGVGYFNEEEVDVERSKNGPSGYTYWRKRVS